jgi:hypothetical protein
MVTTTEVSISVEIITPQPKRSSVLNYQFASGTNYKKRSPLNERIQQHSYSTTYFLAVPIVFHSLASNSNYYLPLSLFLTQRTVTSPAFSEQWATFFS